VDLHLSLVAAVLKEGRSAFDDVRRRGLKPDMLQGEGQKAFTFVEEFVKKYGKLPTSNDIFGVTQVDTDLGDPSSPAAFFADQILNVSLLQSIKGGMKPILTALEGNQGASALESLELLVKGLRQQASGASVESLFKLGPEVRTFYEKIKSGERGILTPWPSLNDMTLGFWPEDLVLFVARVGVGKTWTAVNLAMHAWATKRPQMDAGARVLFITTEVSRMRIGMRFYALRKKLNYKAFTHGQLGHHAEQKLFEEIEGLLNSEGLYIVGGDFDFQIESVEAAIDASKPDLVILDGVYLLRVEGHTRTERMANAFDEVKRMAKRKKVPIVITTQFNREVKKNMGATVQVESIALSDVGGWNADLIVGLLQTDEMRAQKQMMLKPLKVREGEGQDVMCVWDFETMTFGELNPHGGGGGDADEFMTGTKTGSETQEVHNPDDEVPF
jgi:replicative DNA helicase